MNKERPDLFTDNERPGDARQAEMEHLAPPEPYIVPSDATQPSASTSEYGGASSTGAPGSSYGYGIGTGAAAAGGAGHQHRPSQYSLLTSTEGGAYGRPGTPGTSASTSQGTSSRKGGAPPVLRPVNVIELEDAGAVPQEHQEEPETEELPPAYTNIKRDIQ